MIYIMFYLHNKANTNLHLLSCIKDKIHKTKTTVKLS
jgi:hypothetical protein